MSRYVVDPDSSQVWIEGSSSVHPITATATGLTGWVDVDRHAGPDNHAAGFAAEIRIAVDRLASGNPLVDRETRRRIDARRHPEIVGTVTTAVSVASDRLALTGTIDFRGETRSVSGEVAISPDRDRLVVEGTQTFDLRDLGATTPTDRPPTGSPRRAGPHSGRRRSVAGLRRRGYGTLDSWSSWPDPSLTVTNEFPPGLKPTASPCDSAGPTAVHGAAAPVSVFAIVHVGNRSKTFTLP